VIIAAILQVPSVLCCPERGPRRRCRWRGS